jgi:hypothetical protein
MKNNEQEMKMSINTTGDKIVLGFEHPTDSFTLSKEQALTLAMSLISRVKGGKSTTND